jgi:hypothetical protein
MLCRNSSFWSDHTRKNKGTPMSKKKLKKELSFCAMSAIQWDIEIKEYFGSKVASGKQKMLILNNVKNKLIHRVCACVKKASGIKLKNDRSIRESFFIALSCQTEGEIGSDEEQPIRNKPLVPTNKLIKERHLKIFLLLIVQRLSMPKKT